MSASVAWLVVQPWAGRRSGPQPRSCAGRSRATASARSPLSIASTIGACRSHDIIRGARSGPPFMIATRIRPSRFRHASTSIELPAKRHSSRWKPKSASTRPTKSSSVPGELRQRLAQGLRRGISPGRRHDLGERRASPAPPARGTARAPRAHQGCSPGASPSTRGEQTLLLEMPHGLANRSPAHTQVGGQLDLAEVVSGTVLPRDDRRPDAPREHAHGACCDQDRTRAPESTADLLAPRRAYDECQQSVLRVPTVHTTKRRGAMRTVRLGAIGDAQRELRLPSLLLTS